MLRKRWLWKTFLAAAVYGFLPCWAALLRHGENLNEFILYVLGGKIFSPLNNPPVLLFAFIPTVLLGLATRASFTDVAQDPSLGKAVYWYNSDITPQTLEDSAQNLMEQSKLIAVVRYQGEQDYTNQTFLTKAEVVSVYQGDASLEGDHILIYEPVRLYYSPAHEWLHDAEVYQFIGKIPGAEADDRFVNGFPKTEPMCYHAPMQEGREYLVFLTPKEYPKESPLYQQEEEYNYVESIYALLDLSAQPENFMPAPELILLEEAAEYPVLLMNEAELERYIRNREEIINSVLGDGH